MPKRMKLISKDERGDSEDGNDRFKTMTSGISITCRRAVGEGVSAFVPLLCQHAEVDVLCLRQHSSLGLLVEDTLRIIVLYKHPYESLLIENNFASHTSRCSAWYQVSRKKETEVTKISEKGGERS